MEYAERGQVSDHFPDAMDKKSNQSPDSGRATFRRREFRGSRLRCLIATSLPRAQIATWLSELVAPRATVSMDDVWMPSGLLAPEEAELGKVPDFLDADSRADVTAWWLARPTGARTPNWDIVSTCTVNGRRGLVLVEAKAHAAELSSAGKPPGNKENEPHIRNAISAASAALNATTPGWNLSADSHYQLANRFAWGWKLASQGVPVVLLYLGFLNATEMLDCGTPFASAADWERAMTEHCRGIVPSVWGKELKTGHGTLAPLLRSADVRLQAIGVT